MKPQIANPTLTVFSPGSPHPITAVLPSWPSVWLRERGFTTLNYFGSSYQGDRSWGIFGRVMLTDGWLAGTR